MTKTLALSLLSLSIPLWAHHSTSAEYDSSRIVQLQGVVTEVRWLNPHASFLIDVTGVDGKVVNWAVELPAPSHLIREGYNRSDIRRGDRITVDVWLAKSEIAKADARSVKLADGRTISGASIWDRPPVTAR